MMRRRFSIVPLAVLCQAAAIAAAHAQSLPPKGLVPRDTRTVKDDRPVPPYVPGGCNPGIFRRYRAPTTTLSAVHYYPWHVGSPECPAGTFSYWCNCIWAPKPQNPRPAIGFYDSSDPMKVAAQLDQMVQYGIDVVSIEWTGIPAHNNNILNVVVPAIASRPSLSFVLLYDLKVRFLEPPEPVGLNFNDGPVQTRFTQDLALFAASASYFKHPSYLKFGNKPVIYIYITRAISGSDADISNTFSQASIDAVNNGFTGRPRPPMSRG